MSARLIIMLQIALLLAGTLSPVGAAGYVYSESHKTINVCNLLLPGVDPNANPALGPISQGYRSRQWNAGLFGILNERLDLKPAGWEFANPLAPTIVSNEIAQRYSDYPSGLVAGQYVTKDMPCYWDVKLSDVTLNRLLQFDLVYLSIPAGITAALTPDERELLRKLVDSGAQLWIDWGGGGAPAFTDGDCGSGFFLSDTNFQSFSRAPAFVYSRHHALVSYPYWLSQPEINSLGANTSGGVVSDGRGNPPFQSVFAPVVGNGGPSSLPQVAAGQYGSGHIILTSNNIGANIIRWQFGGNPDMAAAPDLKFAYNVIAWGSNYTTTYKDASHSSAASQGPGAPLVMRWQFPVPGATGASPVIYKGVVFYSDSTGNVRALDGVPQQDLDNDGNPDDGIEDYASGATFDQLWVRPAGGNVSGPTVFTWPGGGPIGPGVDVVMVLNGAGKVLAAPAFPSPLGNAGGFADLLSVPGWGGGQIPSPTYHNGIIYVMGGDGYLYCLDPATGETWNIPGNMTTPYGIQPRPSSPTVGWSEDVGTKALDLMAYWVAGTTMMTVQPSDRLFSAIFSVRNEPLARLGGSVVATRYNNSRTISDLPYALWAVLPNGGCQDLSASIGSTTTKGQFVLSNPPSTVNAATPVYADYQLSRNMALATTGQDLAPRSLYSPKPDPQQGTNVNAWQASINSTPAMGPDGTLYITGERGVGSQLSAVQEYGPRFNLLRDQETVPQHWADWHFWSGSVTDPSDPMLLNRFYPAYDYTLDGSDTGPGVPLDNLRFVGPPAVTSDAVYVTAYGDALDGSRAVVLFAFARKWQFQIKLPAGTVYHDTEGRRLPVRVWQPSPFSSLPSVRSPREEAALVRGYALDTGRNTITISNFDDANILIGSEKRPLFAGIPVRVWVGDAELPANIDHFSNLRWYFVAYRPDTVAPGVVILNPGNRATGGPTPASAFGQYVYFGTEDGMIYAVRAAANPSRGKQVFGVKPNYVTDIEWQAAAKDVVWQSRVTDKPITDPIAAAGGLLAAVSAGGLAVFDSPGTIIADNNRILEVDAGSGAVWSINASTQQTVHGRDPLTATGMSVRKTPFSRPSVVRSVDKNDLVVCDTGNNRIVRVDRAGNTIWEIREFVDPLTMLSGGEPRTLSSPKDVRVWSGIETDPLLNIPAFIYHYLVADRDNFRVLDLIARFDLNGRALPISNDPADAIAPGAQPPTVLNWVSSTRSQGRLLRFETAQMFPRTGGVGPMDVWAAVSNYSVEDPNAPIRVDDAQGGAVVRLDYADLSVDGSGNATWTYKPGNISWATNLMADGAGRKMANPRYFERFWTAGGVHSVLCDNSGVWELTQNAPEGPFDVVWKLTSADYQNALERQTTDGQILSNTGVPLRASSAKILPNGRVLIANSYTGFGASGAEFHGEVFEVDRTNDAGNPIPVPTRIFWSAPSVVSVEVAPGVTGVRQELGGSYLIEQPTFVDRR